MKMPKGPVLYALLGAVLAYLLSRKRKNKTKSLLTGAALGAGAAFLAPKAGVNLPGLLGSPERPANG